MRMSDDFPMMMEREFGMPQDCPPVAVSFGMYPVVDNKKTLEAGHEVYREVEFVKIAIPGDRNSLFFQPSTVDHQRRFPNAYSAYKARERKPIEGMPIEEWAPISRSLALTLRAAHIDTVEALAAVHDGNIDRIGTNGRDLREKARAWLEEAKSGAAVIAAAAKEQALQDQIAALQAQIEALKTLPAKGEPQQDVHVSKPQIPHDDVETDVAAAARRPRRAATA